MKKFWKAFWFVLRLVLVFALYVELNHLTIIYESNLFYEQWVGDAGSVVYAPAVTIIVGVVLFWNNFHSIEIFGANFELRKQVQKAVVEYETFRKSVAPLVRLELSRIERDGRIDMGLAVDELKNFVFNEVPILQDSLGIKDSESELLFKIARAKVISLYRGEIARMVADLKVDGNSLSMAAYEMVDEFIDAGLEKPNRPNRLTESKILVDVDGLQKWLSDNNPDWQSNHELVRVMNELSDYFVKAYKTAG